MRANDADAALGHDHGDSRQYSAHPKTVDRTRSEFRLQAGLSVSRRSRLHSHRLSVSQAKRTIDPRKRGTPNRPYREHVYHRLRMVGVVLLSFNPEHAAARRGKPPQISQGEPPTANPELRTAFLPQRFLVSHEPRELHQSCHPQPRSGIRLSAFPLSFVLPLVRIPSSCANLGSTVSPCNRKS